jgi:hypothetical protein
MTKPILPAAGSIGSMGIDESAGSPALRARVNALRAEARGAAARRRGRRVPVHGPTIRAG